MNINYELGNVIASATSFNNYKFPAQLPTEEWAGDEVRSYVNYIRPVANLFENDRESQNFSKEIIDSLIYKANKNSVADGCKIVGSSVGGNNYYEIQEGYFLNEGGVYHIFPSCEAVAKQIRKEYILQLGFDLDIKIWYNDESKTYYYKYMPEDATESTSGETNTAVQLVYDILNGLELLNDGYKVEDHIILPIFKNVENNNSFYFNSGSVNVGTPTSSSTVLGKLVDGNISYADVVPFTIDGAHIQKETAYITIGSTRFNLWDAKTDISGVEHLNGVNISSDGNKFKLRDESSHALTVKDDYTLGTACEKDFSTSISLDEDAKLPTAAAVKVYVEDKINNQTRTDKINFTNGINVSGGGATVSGGLSVANGGANITGDITADNSVYIKSTADASRASSAVSMTASIRTEGGIEAKKNIFADGSIIGTQSGIYSLRKLKENIVDFNEDAVDLINSIDIVSYNYKSDDEKNYKIGFIADDTHEYFATKNHNIMDQSNCIGLLLKAVQELSAENERLKEEMNAIKQKIGD